MFDGQVLAGQNDITVMRGRQANEKTDQAWELYFNGRAEEAVSGFGQNSSMSWRFIDNGLQTLTMDRRI